MAAFSEASAMDALIRAVKTVTLHQDVKPQYKTYTLDGRDYNFLLNFSDVYTIEELIGSGTSGSVFLAQDRRSGRNVAIKFITPLPLTLPYLASEISVLNELKDIRSVPDLVEAFVLKPPLEVRAAVNKNRQYPISERDYPFDVAVVMEYIYGDSVKQAIEEKLNRKTKVNDPEEYQTAACFAYWLFSTLEKLHKRDIVHRDIKPDNIIMCQSEFFLVDFGYSCSTDPDVEYRCRRFDIGSPMYLELNLLENGKTTIDYVKGNDVWSAAVTIYEFCHPKMMYAGDDVEGLIEFIKDYSYQFDESEWTELGQIMNDALTLDRDQRPTAESIRTRLESVILPYRN